MNRQIVLASRPHGMPVESNFAAVESPMPTPAAGEVLLQHTWLGLAPAARLRMSEGDSYTTPLSLGEVVYGQAVGVVLESRHPAFRTGDLAASIRGGWQAYSVATGEALVKIDPGLAPPSVWLSALGTSGMTAYVGLLDFGRPEPQETVVISAAGGAVGSAVGQIAKIKGCRAVGLAGGPEKCRFAREQFGLDACIDYRADDVAAQLDRACPRGIDVYFENVGGVPRNAAWPLLTTGARIVVCGLISEYNDAQQPGPGWSKVLMKRLSLRGFILSDHLDRRAAFQQEMGEWYSQGRVRVREDICHGLDQAAPAFIRMLQGLNLGKALVRL